MTERINIIVEHIPNCNTFSDVGCDHGYVSLAMLERGMCEKVIFTDISAKCLEKAQGLLHKFVSENKAIGEVADGFSKNHFCDCGLIAGMGGLEIISILNNASNLPFNLVLQPMKNVKDVREVVVRKGYKILTDEIFSAGGKFYDILVLQKGKDCLTQEEIEFGRTNVLKNGSDFRRYIQQKIDKLQSYTKKQDMKESSRQDILEQIKGLKKYV